jgi:ubiquinone/menaquinone biosynthesis C-methylase UbiE
MGAMEDSQDYHEIYHQQAQQYERLVSREDHEGNILRALLEICDPNGRVILELGTGTGRLTKLLLPYAAAIYGFDNSIAMLQVAAQELKNGRFENWTLGVADHRDIPLRSNAVDLIISGWSLCYLALDQGESWRDSFREVFERLERLLRGEGVIIILETLGTGFTTPNPPEFMLDYFSFLQELGFRSKWIRTDYEFETPDEAVTLTRFFFGDELADRVEKEGMRILPECTGIWWMKT